MNSYISKGKLVWSSPKIQTQMGAKDALVKIGKLGCGCPTPSRTTTPRRSRRASRRAAPTSRV